MKVITETPRLLIREFVLEDAAEIIPLHGDPEVIQYTGDKVEPSLEGNQKIIQDIWLKEYKQYGHARWAVVHKADNKIIGWCGLKYEPKFEAIDLGYRYLKSYWGKGIGTEAAKAVIAYGFTHLDMERIVAIAMKENPNSVKIMEKIGMRYEKMAPAFDPNLDLIWYVITKEEFLAQSS